MFADVTDHDGGDDADADAAKCRSSEVAGDLQRGDTSRHRCDRSPQADDRRRVVDQALALEDRHHSAGHSHFAGDRSRGDGVGWSDDSAERERGSEWYRQQPPRDEPDRDGCERDISDRQQPDRADVGSEVDQRCADRCRIQQRRQDADEDHIWIDCEIVDAGKIRDDDSCDYEDERCGATEPACETRNRGHGSDDDDQLTSDVHDPAYRGAPKRR